jgi:hypothetical protein
LPAYALPWVPLREWTCAGRAARRGIAVGEREGRSFAPLLREHIRTGVGRRADPNERLGGSGL